MVAEAMLSRSAGLRQAARRDRRLPTPPRTRPPQEAMDAAGQTPDDRAPKSGEVIHVNRPLRIAFIASEAVPFVKSGGLADVVGALPKVLAARGHEVSVILPRYSMIDGARFGLQPFLNPLGVWMGNTEEWCASEVADLASVRFFFIDSEKYFARFGLYHDTELEDYRDNARRYGFFTRAALQLLRDAAWKPDVVHVHDWQTALAPAYLKIWHWDDAILGAAASVLTIHNIGHQGKYPAGDDYEYLGLQHGNFTAAKFEDFGGINFLKGGIFYADLITTVSSTYAEETRGEIGGNGLGPTLAAKGEDYWGILNGVDYEHWSPASDALIPARFDSDGMAGKAVCKKALQERLHLRVDPEVPLIGVISRFVGQKGLDLLAGCIDGILATMHVQFAILGAGDKSLEWTFGPMPGRYPGGVGSYIGHHEELAHWIEAGADFFLMPSRYEPCGLNQIYSLKYGTLPIVRATGGLNDTVRQYDEATGAGTGFKFVEPTAQAVYDTVGWAISTWYDRPQHIAQMRCAAMTEDFSWERIAPTYEAAYARAIANKRGSG
jgi:starch synthase